jgi:hypothetical protein
MRGSSERVNRNNILFVKPEINRSLDLPACHLKFRNSNLR